MFHMLLFFWANAYFLGTVMWQLCWRIVCAMLFSTVSLTASFDDCSEFCMLPRSWSLASDAIKTSHWYSVTLFTGCWYHNASSSKLRWWCSTVLAADVQSTSVMCTLLFIPSLHVRDYDLRTMEISSFHACGRPIWAASASTCVFRQSGTNFQRIAKHRHQGTV